MTTDDNQARALAVPDELVAQIYNQILNDGTDFIELLCCDWDWERHPISPSASTYYPNSHIEAYARELAKRLIAKFQRLEREP